MVIDPGSTLSGITFEDLAKALDSDADFRAAVIRHLGGGAVIAQGGRGNHVNLETRAHFSLDDSRIFDLNGEGLQVAMVAVN